MADEIYRSPWFNLEGYLACSVKYSDGTKRTVLQHRERMEAHLGRRLRSDELVHHKDENKRHNEISNFEIKTNSAHAKEHAKDRHPETVEILCLECGMKTTKLARSVRHNQARQGKPGPFCSRSCSGRFNGRKRVYG